MPEPLWEIGGDALVDNYEDSPFETAVWRAGAEGQAWPLFHASEADPEGGYRLQPYTIVFDVSGDPAPAYELAIAYLVIAPRVAHLLVEVNGVTGLAYPVPRPAAGDEIRLHAGLHTTLSHEGELRVAVPGELLVPGENRLVLTARDGGEVLRARSREHVKRLDRMANAAGLVYQRLALTPRAARADGGIARAELLPSVVYRRRDDGVLVERCALHVELDGPAAETALALRVDGHELPLRLPAARFGHVRVPFELPDGPPAAAYELTGRGFEQRGELRRRRKWRVHVTPHVHTDVGYTHRQWEVAERLARTIDAALDGAADAYHLDSAFALETWLETRSPERTAALRRAAAGGGFGVSGIYVDLLTQTAALEDLVRNEARAARLLGRLDASSDFAAVVDVASLTGSLPALLEGAGLRYLVHADNQDRGPFRLNGGLHRLSPYWWEGTSGGRVLVWLAKMYCELRKVCGSPPVLASAERGLDLWLQEFERDDYLPDTVLLYGQEADNTDLDPQPAEFVRRWNETYAYPQLVPSAVSAFFREVEPLGARLPVVRGDGGAYWEDGCGSAAELTALARRAQADLPAAERLEALAALHDPGRRHPAQRFDDAWRALLLWDEHTWGAFLSAREPDALLQRDQWAVKEGFGRNAAARAGELLHAAASAHALQWPAVGREVVVHNPHSWPVSGAAIVEIEPDEELDAPTRTLVELATQTAVEVWVDDLPALGYRRFPLRRGARRAPAAAGPLETVLRNERFRIEVDAERGCVRSFRADGRELVDAAAPWGFGALVQALGGEGTRLVSNRATLPAGDPRVEAGFALRDARFERFGGGAALTLSGAVAGGELDVEWTLRERAAHADVAYRWRKEERRGKEAVYVAFPADLPGARVLSDSQLGWVAWGEDDLPGACQEWLPLQTSVLVRGDGLDLQICSPDVPLFCVGGPVRGRWPKRQDQTGGRILSYVLNNYWHTNYPAAQGGELTFRYRLAAAPQIDAADAYRRGWEARRPPYGQRLGFQDFRAPRATYADPSGGSLAAVAPDHVVLVALKGADDGRGFVARFQEIAGRPARASLRLPGRRIEAAWRTDLVERDLEPLDGAEVDVEPWGLATVRFVV